MERPRTSLCVALAALAYLVIALFVLRAVLPSPGRLLPYPALLDLESRPEMDLTLLDHRDQSMVVSVVSRNAAILVSEPSKLFTGFGTGLKILNVQGLMNSFQWGQDNRVHVLAGTVSREP